MSLINPNKPPNTTDEQYKRIMTNYKILNQYGQPRVTESTLRKLEDAGESMFDSVEKAEDTMIDDAIDFLHSTRGIVTMLLLLIVITMCCGLCYFCKGCYHDYGVRKRLKNLQKNTAAPGQNQVPNGRDMTTVV